MTERGFRPRQKGVECSTEGCDAWCVSNDLCPKCNMRERRRNNPEAYKAATKLYNQRYKRPDIKKVCDICYTIFVTARENQEVCSDCSGSPKANSLAQKRHRAKEVDNG